MELISELGIILTGSIVLFLIVIGALMPYFVFRIFELNKDAHEQREQIKKLLNHIAIQQRAKRNENNFIE